MEKKNTVLLTVIAVATLLVAVVGATFAYFTATSSVDGAGNTTDVKTRAEVGGVELKLASNTATTDGDINYPGGYVVNGATVTAKSTNATDNYKVNYALNGTITNNTDTALNYKIYQTTSAASGDIVSGCTMRQYQDGTEIRYTYLPEGSITTTCTVNSTITGGTVIKSGTVAAATVAGDTTTPGTETIKVSSSDVASMALTSTNAGASTYYYLVVEYPDTGAAQAAAGKGITATLSSVSDATSTVAE